MQQYVELITIQNSLKINFTLVLRGDLIIQE
jgi:hypothetical protein